MGKQLNLFDMMNKKPKRQSKAKINKDIQVQRSINKQSKQLTRKMQTKYLTFEPTSTFRTTNPVLMKKLHVKHVGILSM